MFWALFDFDGDHKLGKEDITNALDHLIGLITGAQLKHHCCLLLVLQSLSLFW